MISSNRLIDSSRATIDGSRGALDPAAAGVATAFKNSLRPNGSTSSY